MRRFPLLCLLALCTIFTLAQARAQNLAQTAEQFLEGMFPIAFGSCSAPNMAVQFYCEIFTDGQHRYLVLYDDKSEAFAIKELMADGTQKVVWKEGEPV